MKYFAVLLVLVAPISFAQNISSLLPDSIGDYMRSDSARIYAGNELYNLVDGGADLFKEYGFDRVVVQRYSDTHENNIDLELYEMRDSTSAYGIFSIITFTTGRRIADFPCEAYAGDGFLLFRKGKYYGSLMASQTSDSCAISKAAETIAGRIRGSGRPYLVSIFDKLRLSNYKGFKVAYLKGGLGLSNLGVLSSASGFNFKEGACIVANDVKCFIFLCGSEGECVERYSSLLNRLGDVHEWNQVRSGRDSGLYERGGEYLEILRIEKYLSTVTSKDRAKVDDTSVELSAGLK